MTLTNNGPTPLHVDDISTPAFGEFYAPRGVLGLKILFVGVVGGLGEGVLL